MGRPQSFLAASIFVLSASAVGVAQRVDKERVVTVNAAAIEQGVIAQVMWDGGVLMLQGVVAEPGGQLAARYFVKPANSAELKQLKSAPPGAEKYWQLKSSRVSPTALGRIEGKTDTKLPMYGVGTLETRVIQAAEMGGTITTNVLKLGSLVMYSATGVEPYDGQTWSWSPAELNKIAYVDAAGDLSIADADGRHAERVLRGNYTLPAWSEDGRAIAVVERLDGGRRWDVFIVHVPEAMRRPPR